MERGANSRVEGGHLAFPRDGVRSPHPDGADEDPAEDSEADQDAEHHDNLVDEARQLWFVIQEPAEMQGSNHNRDEQLQGMKNDVDKQPELRLRLRSTRSSVFVHTILTQCDSRERTGLSLTLPPMFGKYCSISSP